VSGVAQTIWFSLRRRLLINLLGGLGALWLATMFWSYWDTHHEIDEIYDAQLVQAAQQAMEQYVYFSRREARHRDKIEDDGSIDREDHERAEKPAPRLVHRYQQKIALQILDRSDHLLQRSPNAPDTALAVADGFSEGSRDSERWRYYSEWSDDGKLRVVVGENHSVRGELIGKIATHLALPLLIGLPLTALWIGLALTRGLAPLTELTGAITARGPEQLDALTPRHAPTEIRPLIESLNALLARLSRAIEGERRFTADAAHELRTPLAGLRAQAQVALRAADEPTRKHALEQVLAGTGRAARLIDQLLTLARLDPTRQQGGTARADLAAVAADVCAELGAGAVTRDIALTLDAEATTTVNCAPEWLRILMRNLVDNALRYTPDGGSVRVVVAAAVSGATLQVIDSGPGIPAADRAAVFERFHRLAGQEVEGSGLGLSIVARIAELAGATITLNDGEAGLGLAVTVAFPVLRAG
jgi:two-component system sensor histidine kinase QseC